jgi:hypothetical protein
VGWAGPISRGWCFAITFTRISSTYLAIAGGWHTVAFYEKFRERELRAAELEATLAQAQLQALKMQLQPHFLFNTLQTIAELVHQDPNAADQMILRSKRVASHHSAIEWHQ